MMTIIKSLMASNKLQLFNDLMGVFRGVYIIHSHAAQIPTQRRLALQRQLTSNQRDQIQMNKMTQDLMSEQMQPQSEEGSHEKTLAEVDKASLPFTQGEPIQVEAAQPIFEKPVEKVITVETIQPEAKQAEAPAQPEPTLGESPFGKSQQQTNTQVVDDIETPFFMRQDRPKFSAQERYVPSTQAQRAFQYGILSAQLIGGTVKEAFKQKIVRFFLNQSVQGLSQEIPDQQGKTGIAKYAINASNANALQQNFRKMRGAVLKLGQILSTGEASIVPPVIRDAMEKARSEADIMPVKQVMKILDKEYGTDWSKRFREINLYPFAAASIGQVHEAILKDGMKVALKIQYNGVADSIDSDLNNFMRLVNLFGGLPRGLFLNELVETTRHELYWETDYLREATMQRQYAERLTPYPKDYYCPKVISDMSTKHLLCTEFIDGVEIDTLTKEPQETRDRAGSLLLQLCFKELFEWKIMQTDPNPANFLYDVKKQRLNLIDLGSGRTFEDKFLDGYMKIIHGGFINNKDQIIHYSKEIGFLTGEENKEMLHAHYLGVLVMAEPFQKTPNGIYDFASQQIMKNADEIVPAMSKHRLTPPPKEIYSLHRKILGAYMMCMKLRSKVPAREIFMQTHANWLTNLKTV